MRNRILFYALKYNGDYNKIKQALIKNEPYKLIKSDADFIVLRDDNYPKKLLQLKNPPFILFYKGDIKLLNKASIGIVGSRNISAYGSKYTRIVSEILAERYIIVSGLAKGVDREAHLSALKKGHTIAVLGSGINYIYPKSNSDLYQKLLKNNLIISEYPNFVAPKPYFFPFRNRIIAALSKSIVVTQATMRSGTLLTVNEALELNKDIYVLPYPIDCLNGSGCNYLIQQGANVILIDDLNDLCNNV